jgi:hypothetical protein
VFQLSSSISYPSAVYETNDLRIVNIIPYK